MSQRTQSDTEVITMEIIGEFLGIDQRDIELLSQPVVELVSAVRFKNHVLETIK
jgi:hypothetical protein